MHSPPLDFAYNFVLASNTFDVLGCPVTDRYHNDGETILTEGGWANRTENLGVVSGATRNTLTDPKISMINTIFPSGCIPENYGVAIVSGTGAGQSRRITAIDSGTISVSPSWPAVLDSNSHYVNFA